MKPVFTETMQIGIVVRNLDAAIRKYVDDYGIGPWEIHKFSPGDLHDLREYGKPVTHNTRIATTMIGHVMWELIEPLDNESMFARFLAEKGEGVHHIAVPGSELRRDRGDGGKAWQRAGSELHVRRHQDCIPRHRPGSRCAHRSFQRPAWRRNAAGIRMSEILLPCLVATPTGLLRVPRSDVHHFVRGRSPGESLP